MFTEHLQQAGITPGAVDTVEKTTECPGLKLPFQGERLQTCNTINKQGTFRQGNMLWRKYIRVRGQTVVRRALSDEVVIRSLSGEVTSETDLNDYGAVAISESGGGAFQADAKTLKIGRASCRERV